MTAINKKLIVVNRVARVAAFPAGHYRESDINQTRR